MTPARPPRHDPAATRLCFGILAAAVLAAAAAHGRSGRAALIAPVPAPAGPLQAATATADPRPNLVARSGRWLVRGRWLPGGRQEVTSWDGRCLADERAGQQLHACVANEGAAPSGPFAVVAEPDPATVLLAVDDLAPGETLCAPIEAAPGTALVVDPADAVDEAREDDNRLAPVPVPTLPPIAIPTCVPRPTPRAELSGHGWSGVVDWVGPGCLPPGTPVATRSGALVANDGEVAAGPFRVGPPDWHVPGLPADAARSREDARFAGVPSMTIDADDAVPEHDETNNLLVVVVATPPPTCTPEPTPALPDLVPSFSLELPRCRDAGGTIHGQLGYRPCVVNDGPVEARGFLVRFGEGDAAEDVYVPQLDGGGRLCLAARFHLPADIAVDPDDRVAESNEANNRADVLPPPQAPPPLCTPGPPPTETPVPPPLPNLRGWARWWIDLPLGCLPPEGPIPPFQAELSVQNDGAAPAGAFEAAAAPPSTRRWAFDGLPAGATYTRGPSLLDFMRVAIDPDDRVAERDETDNDVYVPVPTLPPYCPTATATTTPATPTPTPTGTASPAPTATATATSEARRVFAPYAEAGGGPGAP